VPLTAGLSYRVDDLFLQMMEVSANASAIVLSEYTSGNAQKFVAQSKQIAKKLKLADTDIINGAGIPNYMLGDDAIANRSLLDSSKSSAYDIAVLSRAVYQIMPQISQFTGNMEGSASFNQAISDKEYQFAGLKTGSSGDAGASLSALVFSDQRHLISVVLNAGDYSDRATRFVVAAEQVNQVLSEFKPKTFAISTNIKPMDFEKTEKSKIEVQLAAPETFWSGGKTVLKLGAVPVNKTAKTVEVGTYVGDLKVIGLSGAKFLTGDDSSIKLMSKQNSEPANYFISVWREIFG
jgi:D-alanyl-D-alanine carboxypeptidase